MAKIQSTIRAVWWRGYQAVVEPTRAGRASPGIAPRRTARGTERVPRVHEADDGIQPRRLAHVPRRRLENLAWRYATTEEREASGGGARRLRVRRGGRADLLDPTTPADPAAPDLVEIRDCTDVELMMKIPIDVLAGVAYVDDDCDLDHEEDDRGRACG